MPNQQHPPTIAPADQAPGCLKHHELPSRFARRSGDVVRLSDILQPERVARRYVVETIGDRLTPDQRYAAELVASELVTNAFRYGRPPIDLALHISDGDRISIEVRDADPTSPTPRLPCEDGGFGLSIVSAHADIKVTSTNSGKAVLASLR